MGVVIEKYSGPAALLGGLKTIRERGVTPRGLLFLALDAAGTIHVATPDNVDQVTSIRVGDKLALVWPLEGRFFHFDSIHRLPGEVVLYNGDRRLKDPGDAPEVAQLIATFVKAASAKNVLFGCTAHQPASWLVDGKSQIALHDHGVLEVVPVPQGLLARRVMDKRLFFLPFARLATGRVDGWGPVFESPLGNVLMLERRVLGDRLVLTCAQGLVEVDVSQVPRVVETARATTNGTMAVVGRIDGGAFAVTSGKPQPWGFDEIRPALLVGGAGGTLMDLGRVLTASTTESRR